MTSRSRYIKEFSVQVNWNGNTGTGILISGNNQNLYLATAKHTFTKDTKTNAYESVDIDSGDFIADIKIEQNDNEVCKVDSISFDYKDLIVFKLKDLKKNLKSSIEILFIEEFEQNTEFFFHGYCEMQLVENLKTPNEKEEYLYAVQDTQTIRKDAIAGCSGSAIFIEQSNEYYLVGILLQRYDKGASFNIFNLPKYLKENPKDGFDICTKDEVDKFKSDNTQNYNTPRKTNILLEEIEEKSSLFVYTDSYYQALTLLKGEDRCCIISGNPGVGKTTLAYMLLLNLCKEEKELEIIESQSFKKCKKECQKNKNKKQIFYFDDFLGESFNKNKLGINILNLIQCILKNKNKYIIFTTREYILKQAQKKYEQLSKVEFRLNKMIIDINHYNNKIKAKILYNHLRCTSLSDKYILALLDNNFFLKIINHKNYNPRIIEHLTDKKLLKEANISSKEYRDYFLKNLDFPEKIWFDIIDNNKISIEARNLLYVLFIIKNLYITNETDKLILEKLREAFDKYYKYYIREHNLGKVENAFIKALKELENSFIYTKEYTYENIIVEFYDPSINDFLFGYLKSNKEILLNLIDGLKLFEYFNYSLGNLFNFENDRNDIRIVLTEKLQEFLIQSVKNRDNLELDEIGFIDKIISNYKMNIDNDMNNKMKESLEKLKLNEKEDDFYGVIKYKYTIKEIYSYYELSIKYRINKYSNQELYDIVSYNDKRGYYSKKGYTMADLFSFSKICNFKEIIRDKDNEQSYIDAFFSDGFRDIIEPIFDDTDGSDNKRNNVSIWANDLFSWLNSYSNQFIINSKHMDNIKYFFRDLLDEIDEEKNSKRDISIKEKKKDIRKEDIIKMFDNIKIGLNDRK